MTDLSILRSRIPGRLVGKDSGSAGIRISTEFANRPVAGTPSDPFEGGGIQAAYRDLPVAGGYISLPAVQWSLRDSIDIRRSHVVIGGVGEHTNLVDKRIIRSDKALFNIGPASNVALEEMELDAGRGTSRLAVAMRQARNSALYRLGFRRFRKAILDDQGMDNRYSQLRIR